MHKDEEADFSRWPQMLVDFPLDLLKKMLPV